MDYTAWAEKNLKQSFIQETGRSVSIYTTSGANKPLLILVHGISGDHNGLVPLAAELVKQYRLVLVDLPGHGLSDNVMLPNAKALQDWFSSVIWKIEKEIGSADAIVAHSFGCSAVLSSEVLAKKNVILINPVPTPSAMYSKYARVIMNSAHFWAHIYNWRLFILLRGMTLAKYRTRESMRRVRWVGWNSKASYSQIVFQAGLVDIILDSSAYQKAKSSHILAVICGMSDTTASERDSLDMKRVFGNTHSIFIRGGHLLPIESPVSVAGVISELLVK
jgi:pimeloyl-ACP methyl ester carboxylesterase